MTSYQKYIYSILVITLLMACGRNVYQAMEAAEPAEDAALAMENDDPDKAIRILNDALADDPDDYKLVALLSAATAQKYGIDTITLALDMASTSASGENAGKNGITLLFSALPDASDENIAGVTEAVTIMLTIPESERTLAENFLLSLLNTALLGLQTKKFDLNGDGNITADELANISDDDAISILTTLANAQQSLASGSSGGDNSQGSGESLAKIQEAIDGQEGASQAEKLRNYLGGQQEGEGEPS